MSSRAPDGVVADATLGDLAPEARAAGRLIGLLDADDKFDPKWFEDPEGNLEQVRTRLGELTTLLAGALGDPEPGASAPDVPGDGSVWYHLPNLDLGVPTVVHVIAPPADATTGQLGVGLYDATKLGPATFEAHVYVPLADLDGKVLFEAQPISVGLSATSEAGFSVAHGPSFTSVAIDVQIYLDGTAPTGTLTFHGLQGAGNNPSPYTSLAEIYKNIDTVAEWLGAVIVQGATPWLLQYPGDAPGRMPPPRDAPDTTEWPKTIGDILADAHFLVKHEQTSPVVTTPPYELDTQNFQGTGKEIAEKLAFAVLDALASSDTPLITLPGGGVYVEHPDNTNRYGVRLAAQIELAEQVDLCIGQWMSGESDEDNWMTKSTGSSFDAGVSILLLSNGTNPFFDPGFSLTSVGLNLRGAAGAPLVDVDGYTLGEAEIRASLAPLKSGGFQWGVAARLDEVGFPLGQGFTEAQGAGDNVVARTLVAGDDKTSPGGADKKPATVDPAFSAEVGYVSTGKPVFELVDGSGSPTDVIWFPVQRSFGPLACEKLGVRVPVTGDEPPLLGVLFDGGVALGPLDVELDELSVNVDLHDPDDFAKGYTLDLQGLAIAFASGGVDISGGLIKSADAGEISYDGEALIQAENLAISALGSFESVEGAGVSLFVFAWLNAPIGGPPCFSITGLSAGFGVNRSLKIPAQSDVQTFPLVAGLSDQTLIGGTRPPDHSPDMPQAPPSPATALAKLKEWTPVERGEYWLAAGLQFTTFEVIKTNALLIVEFGNELVIALLGIATLKQPAEGETLVYAELDLDVVVRPQDGSVVAAAVLAPSSYLLTQDAHLTGGFAFSSWWGANEHRGDFVLTLGGYHPAFDVPAWYPQEPRVGINWQVSSEISVVGGSYFAITPAAMMAGTAIAVTFEAGPLRAWLKFDADVMIRWKPFYLVADASISVGVAYHIRVFGVDVTLSIEIGAAFELWGPEVGFSAHVDWYVVSFTISHGADKGGGQPMSWSDFKGLLPSKTQAVAAAATESMTAAAAPFDAQQPQPVPAYVHIDPLGGLIRSSVLDGAGHWLMRPGQLVLSVHSAVPASDVQVGGTSLGTAPPVGIRGLNGAGVSPSDYQSLLSIAVRACTTLTVDADTGATTVTVASVTGMHVDDSIVIGSGSSEQTVTIKGITGTGLTIDPALSQKCPTGTAVVSAPVGGWGAGALVQQVPKAMWGNPIDPGQSPDLNEKDGPTLPAWVGATLSPSQAQPTNCTPAMAIATVFADLAVTGKPMAMAISPDTQAETIRPVPADSFKDLADVADPASPRDALFAALQGLGVDPSTNDDLSEMANDPGLDFADEPMEVGTA